jgi:hypothetical protein
VAAATQCEMRLEKKKNAQRQGLHCSGGGGDSFWKLRMRRRWKYPRKEKENEQLMSQFHYIFEWNIYIYKKNLANRAGKKRERAKYKQQKFHLWNVYFWGGIALHMNKGRGSKTDTMMRYAEEHIPLKYGS